MSLLTRITRVNHLYGRRLAFSIIGLNLSRIIKFAIKFLKIKKKEPFYILLNKIASPYYAGIKLA